MQKKIVTIFVVISGIIFLLLSFLLVTNNLSWFDACCRCFIASFTCCCNTKVMKAITLMGDSRIMIVMALFVLLYVWDKKKEQIYFAIFFFIIGSTNLLNYFVKMIFYRPRPEWSLVTELGYSFPSAHAMISMVFYGYFIYFTHKNLKSRWKIVVEILFGLLIFSIGVSRIYLGVHYPSDVLGGYALGFIWLMVCIHYTKVLSKKYK